MPKFRGNRLVGPSLSLWSGTPARRAIKDKDSGRRTTSVEEPVPSGPIKTNTAKVVNNSFFTLRIHFDAFYQKERSRCRKPRSRIGSNVSNKSLYLTQSGRVSPSFYFVRTSETGPGKNRPEGTFPHPRNRTFDGSLTETPPFGVSNSFYRVVVPKPGNKMVSPESWS